MRYTLVMLQIFIKFKSTDNSASRSHPFDFGSNRIFLHKNSVKFRFWNCKVEDNKPDFWFTLLFSSLKIHHSTTFWCCCKQLYLFFFNIFKQFNKKLNALDNVSLPSPVLLISTDVRRRMSATSIRDVGYFFPKLKYCN